MVIEDRQLPAEGSSQAHYPISSDIIDIRRNKYELSLLSMMRASLKETANESLQLPPLLLWDEEGLRHFEAITYQDEYYLTNDEIEILKQHSDDIARKIKPVSILVELGSG